MIGDPQLKKYVGKSSEWYYKKALAALAGKNLSFAVAFIPTFGIRSGRSYMKHISAVFGRRCGYFCAPIYTFGPEESAALRAQAIYWSTLHSTRG